MSLSLAKGRSNARKKATQALYQWYMSGNDLQEIEVQFHEAQDMSKVDQNYFHQLLHEVPAQINTLDEIIGAHLDRKMEELDPVEMAVLRLSTYEMKNRLDVPYKVVIDEGIRLAKLFGADKSHHYINGVLDKVAREYRQLEMNQ